ncbi:MAG: hypothetical protein JO279_14885 [Verrucomicrobia bacterium]|nr:hypothetical protein [Verrucomicrobiota bacterium]
MTENDERNSARKVARRRLAPEALFLFLFAWLAAIVTFFLRPGPAPADSNFGVLQFIGSTFITGLECFVFGYVWSRFFRQFKTGCAFVIILFFTYLVWAGRHPR